MNEVEIREGIQSDQLFIKTTWAKGLYYGNDWFKEIEKNIFFDRYPKIIQDKLDSKSIHVLCACMKGDPEIVFSFLIYSLVDQDSKIIHWIFTKKGFRKFGLAKKLIEHDQKKVMGVSHLTKIGRSIKPKEWIFNPFFF